MKCPKTFDQDCRLQTGPLDPLCNMFIFYGSELNKSSFTNSCFHFTLQVIQSLSICPRLVGFVMNILAKLITKQVSNFCTHKPVLHEEIRVQDLTANFHGNTKKNYVPESFLLFFLNNVIDAVELPEHSFAIS